MLPGQADSANGLPERFPVLRTCRSLFFRQTSSRPDSTGRSGCGSTGRVVRTLVSGWLVFHLAAVILAAASVGPSSGLVRSGWSVARPYLQLLFLNHGYHYFAPNPSASHLIAWTAERPDGTVEQGRFPDRATRPRLLYHRYFMLSENPVSLAPESERLVHSRYARCLCRMHAAERVHLSRVVHLIPSRDHIRRGGTLTDPESYAEEPVGTFECSPRTGQ